MCAVVGFVLCITDLTHVAPASSVYVHLYVAVLSAAHSYIVVCVVCCDFPKLFIYKPHGMCASARARVKIAVCDSTIAITIHTRLAGAHIAAQHKQKNIYHARIFTTILCTIYSGLAHNKRVVASRAVLPKRVFILNFHAFCTSMSKKITDYTVELCRGAHYATECMHTIFSRMCLPTYKCRFFWNVHETFVLHSFTNSFAQQHNFSREKSIAFGSGFGQRKRRVRVDEVSLSVSLRRD